MMSEEKKNPWGTTTVLPDQSHSANYSVSWKDQKTKEPYTTFVSPAVWFLCGALCGAAIEVMLTVGIILLFR